LALIRRCDRLTVAVPSIPRGVVRIGAGRPVARGEPAERGDGQAEQDSRRGSLSSAMPAHCCLLRLRSRYVPQVEDIPRLERSFGNAAFLLLIGATRVPCTRPEERTAAERRQARRRHVAAVVGRRTLYKLRRRRRPAWSALFVRFESGKQSPPER